MDEEKKQERKKRPYKKKEAEKPIVVEMDQQGNVFSPSDNPPPPSLPEVNQEIADKDAVEALFMASEYTEWKAFAQSQGWDINRTRNYYPVVKWCAAKKRKLALSHAEDIAQMLFDHRSRWHKDVLTTLKEYPAASDAMLGILKRRMNDMIEDINLDVEEKRQAALEGRLPFTGGVSRRFDKWATHELTALSNALKTVQESKYKGLLLSSWNVKVAQEGTEPEMLGAPPEQIEDKKDDGKFVLQLTGGESITVKRMQELMDQYLDQPGSVGPTSSKSLSSPIVEKAAQEGLDLPLSEMDPESFQADLQIEEGEE